MSKPERDSQPESPHERPNLIAERARIRENSDRRWWRWGPYLSERQWGTVREDYSPDGNAWDYFTHDHARSRAYRWGEDGIAGISDSDQRLCLSIAMWNGRDPILKERLFGLTNSEGNHGEDVKEIYYYLDATPSHSYLKTLYKYPQAEFPYEQLVAENAARSVSEDEFELLDTGIFDEDRYFDVLVEYAKAGPDDILLKISVTNRGPDAARLHLIPQFVLRNTWAWDDSTPPQIALAPGGALDVSGLESGPIFIYGDGEATPLFTENETHGQQHGGSSEEGFFKDAFHEYIVAERAAAVDPSKRGTKAGLLYVLDLDGGETKQVRLKLGPSPANDPFGDFEHIFDLRQREADEFYEWLLEGRNADERSVERQAYAGLIWSKQFYHLDVSRWLQGDLAEPTPPEGRRNGRNHEWKHLDNREVLSMPDAWEYPWYAAWDLAFHAIPLARLDPEFAKRQLLLLTREWYMHPNGQLPAYEWAFGDVNPPVHAWAAWKVYQIEREITGKGDRAFLERIFHKLLLNFTWWVNRKDPDGHNIFEGGFLGLDNIGVFDRSAPLPTGGHMHQADGTSWMAMYSLNLLQIATELALDNPVYEDVASKFFEHFLHIAQALTNMGGDGIALWDEEDEFYYDAIHLPDGDHALLKVRSMVGLIPLFAVAVLDPVSLSRLPDFEQRLNWYLKNKPELAALVSHWDVPGHGKRRLLSLLRGHRMTRLLARMLDEEEFLSPYGIRALSRHHRDHPYEFRWDGGTHTVQYEPAESSSGFFGGNSNWRGPVWFPVNFLLIESLLCFHQYYGDDFKVECPTGSGRYATLHGVADELSRRLTGLFLKDEKGRRPVFGEYEKLQTDPHFKDHVLFYEYFHGDTGRGVGASHQTGWTALVAELMRGVAVPRDEHEPAC